MAEKAVQTAKRLLNKAERDGRDPYLALLDFRNTPRDKELGSPVQRLKGRRTKTTLPTSESLLKPKLVWTVRSNLKEKRMKQKYFYDKTAKTLPPVRVGDDIRIRRGKYWEQGHVIEQANAPRSFVVQSREQTYRRNRPDLLKTREKFPEYMCIPSQESTDILPTTSSDTTTTTRGPSTNTPQPAQPVQEQPHMTCAPSEDSDQPGHPPSLISVFAVRKKKAWVLSYPLSAHWRLIRLGGCPGWSESSLGAHAILLVLSWGGSIVF